MGLAGRNSRSSVRASSGVGRHARGASEPAPVSTGTLEEVLWLTVEKGLRTRMTKQAPATSAAATEITAAMGSRFLARDPACLAGFSI